MSGKRSDKSKKYSKLKQDVVLKRWRSEGNIPGAIDPELKRRRSEENIDEEPEELTFEEESERFAELLEHFDESISIIDDLKNELDLLNWQNEIYQEKIKALQKVKKSFEQVMSRRKKRKEENTARTVIPYSELSYTGRKNVIYRLIKSINVKYDDEETKEIFYQCASILDPNVKRSENWKLSPAQTTQLFNSAKINHFQQRIVRSILFNASLNL